MNTKQNIYSELIKEETATKLTTQLQDIQFEFLNIKNKQIEKQLTYCLINSISYILIDKEKKIKLNDDLQILIDHYFKKSLLKLKAKLEVKEALLKKYHTITKTEKYNMFKKLKDTNLYFPKTSY